MSLTRCSNRRPSSCADTSSECAPNSAACKDTSAQGILCFGLIAGATDVCSAYRGDVFGQCQLEHNLKAMHVTWLWPDNLLAVCHLCFDLAGPQSVTSKLVHSEGCT